MKKLILSIIIIYVSCHTFAANKGAYAQYWSYDEYIKLHPEQAKIAQIFSSQVHANITNQPIKSGVNIAFVYPGKQASDYWRRSVSSFEARLIESGIDYQLNNYFSKPGTEINQQAKHIVSALEYQPDYLIFTLDAMKHQIIIERLIAKKKPKIILQNITTPLKVWGDIQPFLYVGFDHAFGTKILIKEYQKKFPEGAKYAIFYGPKGYVSEMRGGTFLRAFFNDKSFTLASEYFTGFDRSRAKQAALQVFKEHPDIDFIYSCSTDIALGVIDAIKQTDKVNVMTNGWGGGSAELEAIEKGDLEMTVMRMNDDNGIAMADAILNDLNNNPSPKIYSGDIILVDRSMKKTDIDRLKRNAFRYSDHWETPLNNPNKNNK